MTDLQFTFPSGCYGRIAPRSGLSYNNFIDVGGGVIDPDYTGNVAIILFNFSDVDFAVKRGDRIAQLILERIYLPDLVEMRSLIDTTRGASGFGSSGVN